VMQLHAISAALTWALGDNHGGLSAVFAQFARAASPVALDAIWQGAAVALVLFVSLRLAPRVSAAHRFSAWIAGFGAVAALPFVSGAAHWLAAAGAVPAASGAATRAWFEFDDRWALGIAALWLVASAYRLGELVFHVGRLRRLWKMATPVVADGLAARMKLGRVEICTTEDLNRPSVVGFFAPRILLPEWLYARLNPQELKQVVMHEVEHLRRHDDWTNLIQKCVLVLFPLNPALAWIERRLCLEREMACDEGVVRETQAPRAYAACLASLAEHGLKRSQEREMARRAEALSLAAWRGRPELVRRVQGILWRKPALTPVAARVLLSAVGCGLLAGSVELARCPRVVGFEAARQTQQIAQENGWKADRAGNSLPGAATLAKSEASFQVVQAKATMPNGGDQAPMMPATMGAALRKPSNGQAAENEVAWRESSRGMTHAVLLKAEMPANKIEANAAEANAGADSEGPQFIVLTAYERIEKTAQSSREVADYDTGSAGDEGQAARQPENAEAAANRDHQPVALGAPEFVVTRLIFRIDSVGTTASDTTGSNSKPRPGPMPTGQRAVIPFGSGWLVFKL
jgi:hypothetical protein